MSTATIRLRAIVEEWEYQYGKDGLLLALSLMRKSDPVGWAKEYGSADAWPYPAGPYDSIEDLERAIAEREGGTPTGTDAAHQPAQPSP